MKLSVHAIPLQSRPVGARQLPPGGSQGGGYEFALVHSEWDSAYRKPLRRDAPSSALHEAAVRRQGRLHLLNLSGAVKLGSPVGELSSVSETEGVSFVEWELLKVPDCTPFAASRSTIPRCMIATGNHCYLDSLRGAPPPKGAARGAVSSFWLRGRRRCSILPGTGRPAGGSRRFAGPSSPRCCAGPGGRRCRRCPAA